MKIKKDDMNKNITEGYMPFMGYQTYYRIVGEPSEKAPLLLLHGGPGSTHNYFEVLDCIADTGRQVISYDQIGCGNSYLDGHPELWTQKTWIDELIAIREYLQLGSLHILRQSWGAMQAIAYAIDEKRSGTEAYLYGWGPNEYQPLGSLKDFEYTDRLNQITQPTLICSGTRDICTPVVAASLYENIPGSRWHLFRHSRHTCFIDAHKEYCQVLTEWLEEND